MLTALCQRAAFSTVVHGDSRRLTRRRDSTGRGPGGTGGTRKGEKVPPVASLTAKRTLVRHVGGIPFAIARMTGGRNARTPPHLFSLASLRIRYGGGFTCSTSRALGLVRSLCRGGIAACPHMSAAFLDSSVCPGYSGVLTKLAPCAMFATPLTKRGLVGSGGMFSGSGMASRRTVVPAKRPPMGLARVRGQMFSLMTHHFVTMFCPSYGFTAAAMVNRTSDVRFGTAKGRVLSPK